MEMDFGRYAGQLRPLTYRDFVVTLEVEAELDADLERAKTRPGGSCDCYYCVHLKPSMNPPASAPPFAP
jgi:hypothetical protein